MMLWTKSGCIVSWYRKPYCPSKQSPNRALQILAEGLFFSSLFLSLSPFPPNSRPFPYMSSTQSSFPSLPSLHLLCLMLSNSEPREDNRLTTLTVLRHVGVLDCTYKQHLGVANVKVFLHTLLLIVYFRLLKRCSFSVITKMYVRVFLCLSVCLFVCLKGTTMSEVCYIFMKLNMVKLFHSETEIKHSNWPKSFSLIYKTGILHLDVPLLPFPQSFPHHSDLLPVLLHLLNPKACSFPPIAPNISWPPQLLGFIPPSSPQSY